MRVVGYIRVSTEEQALEGVSLAAQEAKVRGYCGLYEHELVKLVVDGGVSAKTLDRPGMREVLAMLESGEVQGMVIANLDRMTRSVRDLNYLIDHHFGEGRPSALMSVSDSLDTRTASGILVINILGSVAQWQRQYIVERTRAVLGHKRSKGERTGGVQFGLDLDHSGRRNKADRPIELVVNDREFEVLRLIEGWDGAGWTLRQIAAALNERGIPTKRGKGPWGHSSVATILAKLPFLWSTYGDGKTAPPAEGVAG